MFFHHLFTAEPCLGSDKLLAVIPKLVTTQDNLSLMDIPSLQEIKSVVFSMDVDSVAGPDGFIGKFFMST